MEHSTAQSTEHSIFLVGIMLIIIAKAVHLYLLTKATRKIFRNYTFPFSHGKLLDDPFAQIQRLFSFLSSFLFYRTVVFILRDIYWNELKKMLKKKNKRTEWFWMVKNNNSIHKHTQFFVCACLSMEIPNFR